MQQSLRYLVQLLRPNHRPVCLGNNRSRIKLNSKVNSRLVDCLVAVAQSLGRIISSRANNSLISSNQADVRLTKVPILPILTDLIPV